MRRVLLVCASAALFSCAPAPEFYKMPPQHSASSGAISGFREFVRVDDVDADAYFVKDVQGLEGSFRWTHAEPTFQFYVKSAEKRRFRLEFGLHDVTFKDTGPVTMVVIVNGHELAKVRYAAPGTKTFDQAVPAEWLKTDAENRVTVQVLNPWPTTDGFKLGFLLYGVGFVER